MKTDDEFFEAYEFFAELFPKDQVWFSPKEAGAIIGRSDQFVRDGFHSGKIFGHLSNWQSKHGNEKKTYLRVHRDAIVLFLIESANYTTEDFMKKLESVIMSRSDYHLLRLEKLIKERLYSKTTCSHRLIGKTDRR